MIDCTFELNGQPMSVFKMNSLEFPAFSGRDGNANRRELACTPNTGPIPPGVYYVLNRQTGGRLGPLRDLFNDRSEWFALYAIDGKIDDETFCSSVRRGSFRLHPRGAVGVSKGCIVIQKQSDFNMIRAQFKTTSQMSIPGSSLTAYGRVTVK